VLVPSSENATRSNRCPNCGSGATVQLPHFDLGRQPLTFYPECDHAWRLPRGLRFRRAQAPDLVLDEGQIGGRGCERARLIQVRLGALRGSHGERPGRQGGQHAYEASAIAGTAGDRPRSLQTLRGLLVTAERLERLAEPGQRGDLFAGPARAVVEAGRLGPIHGSVLERAALVGGDPALDKTVRGIGVRAEGRSRRDETDREGQHSEARC